MKAFRSPTACFIILCLISELSWGHTPAWRSAPRLSDSATGSRYRFHLEAIPAPVLSVLHSIRNLTAQSEPASLILHRLLRTYDPTAEFTFRSNEIAEDKPPILAEIIAEHDQLFGHSDTHRMEHGFSQLSGLVSHPGVRYEIADLISSDLAAGDQVLSIGAGSGIFEEDIHENVPGARVYALDPTLSILRRARERRIPSISGDGQHLPFRPETFDVEVMPESLGHMLTPPAVQEMSRALKPGGRVYVIHYGTVRMWGGLVIKRRRDGYRLQDPADLEAHLKAAGFVDVTTIPLKIRFLPADNYYVMRATKPRSVVSDSRQASGGAWLAKPWYVGHAWTETPLSFLVTLIFITGMPQAFHAGIWGWWLWPLLFYLPHAIGNPHALHNRSVKYLTKSKLIAATFMALFGVFDAPVAPVMITIGFLVLAITWKHKEIQSRLGLWEGLPHQDREMPIQYSLGRSWSNSDPLIGQKHPFLEWVGKPLSIHLLPESSRVAELFLEGRMTLKDAQKMAPSVQRDDLMALLIGIELAFRDEHAPSVAEWVANYLKNYRNLTPEEYLRDIPVRGAYTKETLRMVRQDPKLGISFLRRALYEFSQVRPPRPFSVIRGGRDTRLISIAPFLLLMNWASDSSTTTASFQEFILNSHYASFSLVLSLVTSGAFFWLAMQTGKALVTHESAAILADRKHLIASSISIAGFIFYGLLMAPTMLVTSAVLMLLLTLLVPIFSGTVAGFLQAAHARVYEEQRNNHERESPAGPGNFELISPVRRINVVRLGVPVRIDKMSPQTYLSFGREVFWFYPFYVAVNLHSLKGGSRWLVNTHNAMDFRIFRSWWLEEGKPSPYINTLTKQKDEVRFLGYGQLYGHIRFLWELPIVGAEGTVLCSEVVGLCVLMNETTPILKKFITRFSVLRENLDELVSLADEINSYHPALHSLEAALQTLKSWIERFRAMLLPLPRDSNSRAILDRLIGDQQWIGHLETRANQVREETQTPNLPWEISLFLLKLQEFGIPMNAPFDPDYLMPERDKIRDIHARLRNVVNDILFMATQVVAVHDAGPLGRNQALLQFAAEIAARRGPDGVSGHSAALSFIRELQQYSLQRAA